MSDRIYLFLVGLSILIALYFELNIMIYVVVITMLLEGSTGLTLPLLTKKIIDIQPGSMMLQLNKVPKFNFEALRAMRLSVALVILVSYVAVHEYNIEVLWFFPWFLGFAVLGASVSGVCPVYLAFRWLGFK
ncbi:MAG: hypothetical protein KAJ92_02205 [Gammaproteobacteria bacterium]|nr:hypothetical protein [Gammaproteobacteria bacterium]